MKYYVTYSVNGYWTVGVDAADKDEAVSVANDLFDNAGFGETECVEGEAIMVEEADGKTVWEQ